MGIKIEEKEKITRLRFSDLKVGDVYRYSIKGYLWMKTNGPETYQAICLTDGDLTACSDNSTVIRYDATIKLTQKNGEK